MDYMLKLTKEKLDIFLFTEQLLYNSYNNKDLSSKKASEDFCNFCNLNKKSEGYQKVYEIAKMEVEYMERLSIITIMYSTFEQFLKYSLNFKKSYGSLDNKANDVANNYDYNVKDNLYYKEVDKYRRINNSIKHGEIDNELLKEYPELINKNCNIDEFGTISEYAFNITDDDIAECFCSLCSFANEMYYYFADLGYISYDIE